MVTSPLEARERILDSTFSWRGLEKRNKRLLACQRRTAMHLNREDEDGKGSLSLSVFLVSVGLTVCVVWLVALCGVCGWCQRKLGMRNKPGVETAGTPDSVSVSGRGRGENKAINDLDRDFWNNNDSSTVQQRWTSYPPKEFLLNMSPYTPYGDPRLTPNPWTVSMETDNPRDLGPLTLTVQMHLEHLDWRCTGVLSSYLVLIECRGLTVNSTAVFLCFISAVTCHLPSVV